MLTRRAQFLACAKGARWTTPGLLVQALVRPVASGWIGVGFTATKKLGGAVVRNRARRRMREAARLMLPRHGIAGCDYVFVAREQILLADWQSLLDQAQLALTRVARSLKSPGQVSTQRPPRPPRSNGPRPDSMPPDSMRPEDSE